MNSSQYARVAQAIDYLRERSTQQPHLDEVAEHVGLSPFHFQRLFTEWAGVSPKRFLQYLTVEHAKTVLDGDASLLETTFETGLSSPSRLHDLFVAADAVTPGEYKSRGAGLEVRFGIGESPFGVCFVGATARGIVTLQFLGDASAAETELRSTWSGATLVRDDAHAADVLADVFEDRRAESRVRLLLRGTNFQLRVWRALLEIPFGEVASYGSIASAVRAPGAARAVGSAVGANPVGYLIPCHRVIRATGDHGGYRWGVTRKQSMLAWEQAQREMEAPAASVG
ncbi:MAG: methylated-DNA--[protein]-cysteine S-methyltransferase [Acidobacteria bacterium]|nr:methylated-DNA--[protein]-cysteine S-methyltransferase [Acidobacteriota bacterium]